MKKISENKLPLFHFNFNFGGETQLKLWRTKFKVLEFQASGSKEVYYTEWKYHLAYSRNSHKFIWFKTR